MPHREEVMRKIQKFSGGKEWKMIVGSNKYNKAEDLKKEILHLILFQYFMYMLQCSNM
jgi:hypothetical protein